MCSCTSTRAVRRLGAVCRQHEAPRPAPGCSPRRARRHAVHGAAPANFRQPTSIGTLVGGQTGEGRQREGWMLIMPALIVRNESLA